MQSKPTWDRRHYPTLCCCPSTTDRGSTFHTGASLQAGARRRAMGINRERQRVQWERKMKALAMLKASLSPFLSVTGTGCKEGNHLPLAHMVATSYHPKALPPRRESTLAQMTSLAGKREGERKPSKSVCKCREQQQHAGSAHPA